MMSRAHNAGDVCGIYNISVKKHDFRQKDSRQPLPVSGMAKRVVSVATR